VNACSFRTNATSPVHAQGQDSKVLRRTPKTDDHSSVLEVAEFSKRTGGRIPRRPVAKRTVMKDRSHRQSVSVPTTPSQDACANIMSVTRSGVDSVREWPLDGDEEVMAPELFTRIGR
jgi:hypothetical protein